jgi:hypothetical protein
VLVNVADGVPEISPVLVLNESPAVLNSGLIEYEEAEPPELLIV